MKNPLFEGIKESNPSDLISFLIRQMNLELNKINLSLYNDLSNQYGANQEVFDYHFNKLIIDELIWNEIQNYFPIENFDSYDEAIYFYKRYFNIIAECGCGYVAIANSIFNYFEGREQDFQETFKFPMYTIYDDNTIDYNYELLVLKVFNYSVITAQTDDYCINDIINYFLKDFYSEKIRIFLNNPENNKKLPDNLSDFTEEDWDNWHKYEEEREKKYKELYDKWVNAKNIYKNFGVSIDPNFADIKKFLQMYNMDVKVVLNSNKQYQEGDIVACNNFSLYKVDENGEVTLAIDHVLSHYIYVSGFTEDGKVIVSSWGNKYIYDDENSSWVYKLTLKYN